MEKLYLEDLTVGQTFVSTSLTITADEIVAFAGQYDPQPFHLDNEAAKRTLFGGLAASGWHTAALTMRLLVQGGGSPLAGGIIGGGGEIAWPRPTRPGDTLHVEAEVVEIIPSRSKPDRGMVLMRNRTLNQNGEEVQVFTAKLVVPRRLV
jgi:acyl dehydratase